MEALFFSFGVNLELSVGLGAFLVLIAFQIFFIARRTKVKGNLQMADASRAANVIKTLKKASVKKPKVADNLDSDVFKKFETNLKKQGGDTNQSLPDEEQEVILSISSKSSRRKTGKTTEKTLENEGDNKQKLLAKDKASRPVSKGMPKKNLEALRKLNETIKVDPIEGLFDDVQENLDSKSGETPAGIAGDSGSPEPDRPIASNEFLTGSDLALDAEGNADEIELVLSAARNAFSEGNFEESLDVLRQALETGKKEDSSSSQLIQLLELKADCEFELEQYDRSAKTLQEIIPQHVSRNSPDFLPLLEKFITRFKKADQEKNAIQFLFTALNEYRQLHDHGKMDETYEDIETAYRQLEDWSRLVQTYQNHLTIKKALKDFQGQLDLLDQLGKLLYDQGEEDKSRKCYKQRLVIESEMAKALK
jgi:tetratricopeptide (TPR) repeat protein